MKPRYETLSSSVKCVDLNNTMTQTDPLVRSLSKKVMSQVLFTFWSYLFLIIVTHSELFKDITLSTLSIIICTVGWLRQVGMNNALSTRFPEQIAATRYAH